MGVDRSDVRRVTQRQYDRLKAWAERRPSVALMGEFSAGKSTLMNFLIEEDLLPTRATATELPPVWLTYGRRNAHWVDCDGLSHPLDLADIWSVPMTARFIRIHATAEILEHCDIIDTPGISDPNLAVDSWRHVAGQANMVLWCTSATQAWRETERSAWLSLPERLRRDSILVVTRADKLLTETDREKVRRRLARETDGLFASIVFMATHDAVQAKAELSVDAETPLWAGSGAAALLAALAERFESIYELRSALLRRYRLAGEPDPQAAAVVQARRAAEVLAIQSSRAQARHGSGGPFVLEPAALSDGAGVSPVRPLLPEGGTKRHPQPDATARARMLGRIQEGLKGLGGSEPAFGVIARDAEPAVRSGAEPVWQDGTAQEDDALAGAPVADDAVAPAAIAAAEFWPADDAEAPDADAPEPDFGEDREAGGAGAACAADARSEPADAFGQTDTPAGMPVTDPGGFDDADDQGSDAGRDEAALIEAAEARVTAETALAVFDTDDARTDVPENGWQADDPFGKAVTHTAEKIAPEVAPPGAAARSASGDAAEGAEPGWQAGEPFAEAAETATPAEEDWPATPMVEAPAAAPAGVGPARPAALSPAAKAASALPREVALWRSVVARHPEVAAHAPLVAAIEEFLRELHALSAEEAPAPAPTVAEESGAPAWRRLA